MTRRAVHVLTSAFDCVQRFMRFVLFEAHPILVFALQMAASCWVSPEYGASRISSSFTIAFNCSLFKTKKIPHRHRGLGEALVRLGRLAVAVFVPLRVEGLFPALRRPFFPRKSSRNRAPAKSGLCRRTYCCFRRRFQRGGGRSGGKAKKNRGEQPFQNVGHRFHRKGPLSSVRVCPEKVARLFRSGHAPTY
jgi:hypothetical protein